MALVCVIAAIWQLKMAKTKAMVTKKAKPDPGPSTSCDINGVGREWYNVEEVRDRIMEGGSVLAPNTPLKQEDIRVCHEPGSSFPNPFEDVHHPEPCITRHRRPTRPSVHSTYPLQALRGLGGDRGGHGRNT
mgnify:CR=1 FL=1